METRGKSDMLFKEGKVINFSEDGQSSVDRGIQYFAARCFVSLTGLPITNLGGIKVRKLPAETLTEITGMEMVGIIPLRDYRCIGFAWHIGIMVHTNQDNLLKTHMEGQLEGNISDSSTFPDPMTNITGEGRVIISGVKESGRK